MAALAVLFGEVRRFVSPGAAALARCWPAASLPFWVSATTARFYAPFLLGYLAVLAALIAAVGIVARARRHRRSGGGDPLDTRAGVHARRRARASWHC